MTEKPPVALEKLKSIVQEAINIYEQAQVERLGWEQQAAAARQSAQQSQADDRREAEENAPVEVSLPQARAAQAQLGHLLTLNQEVLQAVAYLLQKAGLAHAMGAPVTLDGAAVRTGHTPEQAASAFSAAQLAHTDLRLALYRLAQVNLDQKQWPAVRRLAQPLLADAKAPLYSEAHRLVCESYWQPASQALRQNQQDEAETLARQCLQFFPQHPQAAQLVSQMAAERQRQAEEKRKMEAERQRQAEEQRKQAAEAQRRAELEKHLAAARSMLGSLALATIPAGKFLVGDNKAPFHLESYQIGKYPVTNAQFSVFEDAAGYQKLADRHPTKANHPLVNVSWNDAAAFCKWASQLTGKSFSLPSDEQWEKAARGTDGRIYPWGSQEPDNNRCNFNKQVGGTTPAGNYSPAGDSPYGCADMSGNVWEWVQSRCLRGGSFGDDAEYVRCACRSSPRSPDSRYLNFGFRVCVAPI